MTDEDDEPPLARMRGPAPRCALGGALRGEIFALDLGALADYLIGKGLGAPASELPRVLAVYRDADSFFGASYLTGGLKSLLEDVLGRLAGSRGRQPRAQAADPVRGREVAPPRRTAPRCPVADRAGRPAGSGRASPPGAGADGCRRRAVLSMRRSESACCRKGVSCR